MQYIAGALELFGMVIVGNKNKWAFIIFIACSLCWIYVAFTAPMYGLLIPVIPSIGINIRNYIKWSKEDVVQDILSDG